MNNVIMIVQLLGGVAIFLYGMNVMNKGLEKVSGGRLEKTLEKLTSNVFKAVLLGAIVTAAIQSSSATTVIVVGLVNAGTLKLKRAIGIIMGANIGTTITAQIIRLADIQSDNAFLTFMKPVTLAPLVSLIGIILFMISKKSRNKHIGEICIGFGILFSGLFAMEASVNPLTESPTIRQALETLSNPIVGVLSGTLVTVIIQSSSASIGILQAISSTGVLKFSGAFPVIMGQNIGTCVTPILSSIGANRNAKRAAIIHLYFNVMGTIVFLVSIYALQYTIGLPFWDDVITRTGIANFHTLFNVVVTILFFPFVRLLEKLAVATVRDKSDDDGEIEQDILDERLLMSPSLAIDHAIKTVDRMASYARKNYKYTMSILNKYDKKTCDKVKEYEDAIDIMEDRLGNYILKLNTVELSERENKNVTYLLHLISEFERIGDYCMNIVEEAELLHERNVEFSAVAKQELEAITGAVEEIISIAIECFVSNDINIALNVEPLEETIDEMEELLKNRHVDRLKQGTCSIDAGVVFLDMLTNIERIGDHCSNVAVYVLRHNSNNDTFDRHKYIGNLHSGHEEQYLRLAKKYKDKYYMKIST